uniref:TLC domain-containing protein n=1 Tax=Heterorhabditis bacteriophora TaxID=37862 RepID=A0A1I7XRE2_HETBA
MLNHEWSRWTFELLFHHIATCTALISGLLPHKLLLADYWALLMEGNSIFLHVRTIMQISGISVERPCVYGLIIYCNIISFILCRFVAQVLFVRWVLSNVSHMHPFYTTLGLGGPINPNIICNLYEYRLIT